MDNQQHGATDNFRPNLEDFTQHLVQVATDRSRTPEERRRAAECLNEVNEVITSAAIERARRLIPKDN